MSKVIESTIVIEKKSTLSGSKDQVPLKTQLSEATPGLESALTEGLKDLDKEKDSDVEGTQAVKVKSPLT